MLTEMFVISLSPSRKRIDNALNRYDRLIAHFFHSTIHSNPAVQCHPTIRCAVEKGILHNKQQSVCPAEVRSILLL